ncbi:uncharacterized protein LOC122084262 isoform X2 [Macadamia integrifolia]|uniref:uncharacterized protein LOC122084262 isoform X2 n=1 Tax=Macadamia integrifolia TaxID=60698 RepID=UPI001C4E2FEB|nr:uncharacterized protein LOC122084262 isoform X2 [Macadamia integrifolia]
MVRRKDRFWEYAEDLKGRFLCKFCHKVYPGGIARIKSHLSQQRGRDIAICDKVSNDVQALALLAIGPNKKRKVASSTNTERSGIGSSIPNASMGQHQVSLLKICEKKDSELVDKDVFEFFLMNNISLSDVESRSFVKMINSIISYGSSYYPPSYSTLCTELIPRARKEIEKYVSTVKESWTLNGCTLMSSIWTDMNGCSFINVVAYSPKGAVFLNSFEISAKEKTDSYLRDILKSVMDEIGPENIVQIILNDTSNYESVGDFVMEKYSHIYKMQCVTHGIRMLLTDIYEEVEWIKGVFDDAKLVVDYIFNNKVIVKLMGDMTNRELKRPCKMEYISYFLMLQSISDAEQNLRLMIASPEWRDMNSGDTSLAGKFAQIIESEAFWSRGKDVLSVLDPLIKVVRLVNGEELTTGYLFEALERARKVIEQCCCNDPPKYSRLLELFDTRRNGLILHKVHAAAAYLNPSLMYNGKIRYEDTDVRDGLNYIVETMISKDERNDFVTQLLLYNGRSPKVFDTIALSMLTNVHPRVWWEFNCVSVPLLQKIAIRILSQPCSSRACELNWGAFEAAEIKKTNKTSNISDNVVFIRMNRKMKAKFTDPERKQVEAIDLENLPELAKDTIDGLEELGNEAGLKTLAKIPLESGANLK